MNNKKRLLLFILILLVSNAITYFVIKRSAETEKIKAEEISTELQLEALHKLDSLNVIIAQQKKDYEALGMENEELNTLKEELEQSIYKLKSGAYKKNEAYKILQDKVNAYEIMLRKKDEEIIKLKKTADKLVSYNKQLKETISEKNTSIQDLEKEKIDLISKVKEASVLNAENFTVVYATEKGKVKDKQPFKAKDIDMIKIQWLLKANVVAQAGSRDVYLIIKEPSGTPIYNGALGGGSFQIEEELYYYTKKTTVNYDPNQHNKASIIYRNPIEFKSGTHTVEIYCDGHMIGKTAFAIK